MPEIQDSRLNTPTEVLQRKVLPCEKVDFEDYEYFLLWVKEEDEYNAYTAKRKSTPAGATGGVDGVPQGMVLEEGDLIACRLGGCFSVFKVIVEKEGE